MNVRIAAVQHGDYVEALRLIGKGEPEPYFGMAYTLTVLRELFGEFDHMVVSLNAPKYVVHQGYGELIGLPAPQLPFGLPGTLSMLLWARQICRTLRRFQPTHVLLRTGGVRAIHVLKYCIQNNVNSMVVFANYFSNAGIMERYLNRKLVSLLNHPSVFTVANHKQPATNTMLDSGVDPRKVLAWDWPNLRHPKDWPAKDVSFIRRRHVVYVGTVSRSKGVADLINAVRHLNESGVPVRLTVAGTGPDMAEMQCLAGGIQSGAVEFTGRVSNEVAFQLMLEATLVCVPSHHDFSEGMPLTLTESLASRTPVIASDHPVFARAFVDGQGIRFFPERNPDALAKLIAGVLSNSELYVHLSSTTVDAFGRVECKTLFGDLITKWKATF